MKLTIFTPTYNREYILGELYKSLVAQTSKDFLWLIVDDGSIDGTDKLVKRWIEEGIVEIQYVKTKNEGKSSAHNKGVELANSELFTCVDSDDYLDSNAVSTIINTWGNIENKKCIGILSFRGYSTGSPLTRLNDTTEIYSTLKNAYDFLGLKGDTMLIYKTVVIKKYRFPKVINEKFIPEAYLYDLLDQEGELYILRNVLYYSEYLEDGYTKNMSKLLAENPEGYLLYLNQRIKLHKKISKRSLDLIRYISISLIKYNLIQILKSTKHPINTLMVFPFGYFLFLKRFKVFKKEMQRGF